MLDVFQSIQKKGIPFMLVLTGLPTLFPKLVEARTFSERMFHVLTLTKLSDEASREAIEKPIDDNRCPVRFTKESVDTIIDLSRACRINEIRADFPLSPFCFSLLHPSFSSFTTLFLSLASPSPLCRSSACSNSSAPKPSAPLLSAQHCFSLSCD